jgi:type IV secretory pathway VirB3-like protein
VNFVNHLAAFWNLMLLIAVFLVLGGFFYTLVIRRMLRVRRIANARDRRLLREAAEREGHSRSE